MKKKMRRNIVYALVALLVLASCGKDKQEADFGVSVNQSHYEELEFDIATQSGLEAEVARMLHQVGETSVSSRFGQDGEKLRVHTKLVKVSNVDNTESLLFNDWLEWTVTNGGRRLSLKSKLLVLRDQLKDVKELKLRAAISSGGVYMVRPIPASGVVNIPVTYMMETRVKRIGTENRLLTNDSSTPAKFIPQGRLLQFKVVNRETVPITLTNIDFGRYYVDAIPKIEDVSGLRHTLTSGFVLQTTTSTFPRREYSLLRIPEGTVVNPNQTVVLMVYLGRTVRDPLRVNIANTTLSSGRTSILVKPEGSHVTVANNGHIGRYIADTSTTN